MKPPRYANASPPGRDTNNIVSNDIVSNDIVSNNIEPNLSLSNNISDIVSNNIEQCNIVRKRAREEISKTLIRMKPAYRAAVKRNSEDPLAYRIEKMLRRVRLLVDSERFMQIVGEIQALEPIEQAALCQTLEAWAEKTLAGGR